MTPFGPAPDAPYKRLSPAYFSLGWSPVPLPAREKSPPPNSPHEFTGERGVYVTETQMRAWNRANGRAKAGNFVYPPGNIALRLPKGVLGIDVDAYEGKAGAKTLSSAEAEWGKLPPTWNSSSKLASPLSGIRLFRIPEGLAWPGELPFGKGVELIRWDHRYAIVAPSIHDKTGDEYFWRTPEGEVVWLGVEAERAGGAEGGFELPAPGELAWLPETWVAGLTGGAEGRGSARALAGSDGGELAESEVKAWLAARDASAASGAYAGGQCTQMVKTLTAALRSVRKAGDDGGAHDAARDGAWALIGDAHAGHVGVGKGLASLRLAFLEAVRGRRGGSKSGDRVASGEWKRAVIRGVSKVAAEGAASQEDICAALSGVTGAAGGSSTTTPANGGSDGWGERTGRTDVAGGQGNSDPFDYKRDDIGNAQRLHRATSGAVAWVPALGGWYLWDSSTGLWSLDEGDRRLTAEASRLVRDMENEAEYIEEPKAKAEFLRFVRGCGNVGRLEAMIKMLRSMSGVAVPAEDFDAGERKIVCPNGVLELGTRPAEPIAFRGIQRDDFATLTTGTRYIPGATSEDWDKYLDLFLPDLEVRAWAQKLAGYSLFGGNPARVFVLARGLTSTGKTTFVNVLGALLGGYAGPFSLSLFRDNQDERARADIVAALPRRYIFTEETSSAWKLHADQLKRATGGGRWSARTPFGKVYLEREPAFTPWVATNNPPTIEGADAALRRRLRVVPFLHQVSPSEDDPFFGRRLTQPSSLEAILAWVVEGWCLYLLDETLTDLPTVAAQAALETANEFSELDECLAELCEFDASASCLASDLYAAYLVWHGVNGDEKGRLSANAFGRQLSNKGIERSTIWEGESGKTVKVRAGLRLREEWQRLAFGGS